LRYIDSAKAKACKKNPKLLKLADYSAMLRDFTDFFFFFNIPKPVRS
jgi:hypothetical protein